MFPSLHRLTRCCTLLAALVSAGCSTYTSLGTMLPQTSVGGQTLPTAHYMRDDAQFHPAGPDDAVGDERSNLEMPSWAADSSAELGVAHMANRPAGVPSRRQMVYTAEFTLATGDVEQAIARFKTSVESLGGYLESRNNSKIVMRVPAARFDAVVDNMSSLGEVLTRSIQGDDVTRQHRDLGLRIETLTAARQRLLSLLRTAEKLEDTLKIEEQLRELTLQLETARGEFKGLGERVAYSRVAVDFQTNTLESARGRADKSSPFAWINQIGVDSLADAFSSYDIQHGSGRRTLSTWLPGAVDVSMPDGFLVVERDRKELKAVTSNDARFWLRELEAPKSGSTEFWSDALVHHLLANRGYKLVDDRTIRDADGRDGRELTFDVVSQGVPYRYLATLFVVERPFWSRTNGVRVTQFVAAKAEFDEQLVQFHESGAWNVVDTGRRGALRTASNSTGDDASLARGQSPVARQRPALR